MEWYGFGTGICMVSVCYRHGTDIVLLSRLDWVGVGMFYVSYDLVFVGYF